MLESQGCDRFPNCASRSLFPACTPQPLSNSRLFAVVTASGRVSADSLPLLNGLSATASTLGLVGSVKEGGEIFLTNVKKEERAMIFNARFQHLTRSCCLFPYFRPFRSLSFASSIGHADKPRGCLLVHTQSRALQAHSAS